MVIGTDRRAAVQAALTQAGIGHLVHYPIACHQQQAYAGHRWPPLPIAEALQHQVLSLPIAPYMSVADVNRVAEVVRNALN
ncbi:DegT/DnrJ/EryC1/StrS family aminotransferase, partial [Roseateles sp.]|uniref:DegT/DnrJ/EryC1/StrS family aminotransferase n=1 Tax=Roseateles sp. TaxID=1971397 RepID=UPI003267DDCE